MLYFNHKRKEYCLKYKIDDQNDLISLTLTSNIRVALGGILGGLPADP